MSRIGNKVINIPAGVSVEVDKNNLTTVKGSQGTLTYVFNKQMDIQVEGPHITIKRPSDDKEIKAIHGTTRAILHNMVVGVSTGFKKALEIRGVGYRAALQGKKLVISAGYSNPVEMEIPEGITVECPKPTDLIIFGMDKQIVGEFAANIRDVRRSEPYKGKGIKYVTETVRRKEGKTAKK